jgi:siroheme synthase-like protein
MKEKQTNSLFPVFLKLETMHVLIVGGGKVGLEKLQAILLNAPGASISLTGTSICPEIKALAQGHANIQLNERVFLPDDLTDADIVILAINDPVESTRLRRLAKDSGKLVNVADQPALCDFYMGSIVQKGNLKIAISTNGKSPTIAKRMKELFYDLIPGEIDEVLEHMEQIRAGLKGDFAAKVDRLNEITKELVEQKNKK